MTFLTPPLISLPMTRPPWPRLRQQLRMVTFSQGTCSFMPKNSLPDFSAMQSSPTCTWLPMMLTFLQLSGSMPSVLGLVELLRMRMFRMSTFSE